MVQNIESISSSHTFISRGTSFERSIDNEMKNIYILLSTNKLAPLACLKINAVLGVKDDNFNVV